MSSSGSSLAAVPRSGRLTIVVLVAAGLAGCGGHSGRSALSDAAGTLRSQAAEGALLADEAASGQVTRIFIREHASDLFNEATQTQATLEGMRPDPSLAPDLAALRSLAGRIAGDLQTLSTSGADAGQVARDLSEAAEAIRATGARLS